MRKIIISLLAVILLFSYASCIKQDKRKKVVVDLLNREVALPKEINRVVCIGPGALMLYSYICDMSLLVGVEDIEKSNSSLNDELPFRPYKSIYQDLFDSLVSIGRGGYNYNVNADKIIATNPDIIISLYSNKIDEVNMLQQECNAPVVSLGNNTINPFSSDFAKALTLLGEVFNRQSRASQLNDYITSLVYLLDDNTRGIPSLNKRRLYVGCYFDSVTSSIDSSCVNYPVFNASYIKNVLEDYSYTDGAQMIKLIDLEKMNPDVIILDSSGLEHLKMDYLIDDKAKLFNKLKAFKNNQVYLQMPNSSYNTNVELSLLNSIYCAKVAYDSLFSYISIENKANEVFEMFYGVKYYDTIKKSLYGGYQKVDLKDTFEKYNNGEIVFPWV